MSTTTIATIAGRIPRPFYYYGEAELAEYRRRITELGGRLVERAIAGAWKRTQVRQGFEFPDGSFLAVA